MSGKVHTLPSYNLPLDRQVVFSSYPNMDFSFSLFSPHYYAYNNKWKNHFSEMKGDVGMSVHEKEGEQEDA